MHKAFQKFLCGIAAHSNCFYLVIELYLYDKRNQTFHQFTLGHLIVSSFSIAVTENLTFCSCHSYKADV